MPNWSVNATPNTGHGFSIFMACAGALRTSCSGADQLKRRGVSKIAPMHQ